MKDHPDVYYHKETDDFYGLEGKKQVKVDDGLAAYFRSVESKKGGSKKREEKKSGKPTLEDREASKSGKKKKKKKKKKSDDNAPELLLGFKRGEAARVGPDVNDPDCTLVNVIRNDDAAGSVRKHVIMLWCFIHRLLFLTCFPYFFHVLEQ